MRTLTPREKNIIRALPCGRCGSIPPFADGSRCHPHRLVPSRGYVANNVVPRCPTCHALEPGHKAVTAHALMGGRISIAKMPREAMVRGGRRGGSRSGPGRIAALSADHRREIGHQGAIAANARRTPEQVAKFVHDGGSLGRERLCERKRSRGLTAGELAHLRRASQRGIHARWHVHRNLVDPSCRLCADPT